MAPYRPPGRSNRSGRTQADNDVFEGLPVKQWIDSPARISLAPPVSESTDAQGQDKWAEPPMPRDFQLLQPTTQALLRLARSGKVGQKRKTSRDLEGEDGEDFAGREDDATLEDGLNAAAKAGILSEDRALVARKWRHVPESALVPEHVHWEFLAKRRKGLPSFYNGLDGNIYAGPVVPMRKTKVQKVVDVTTGESAVYEVLVPEGQAVENEVRPDSELAAAEVKPLPQGTVVEGLGVANEEGVLVAGVARAAAIPRRNRPQQKKKGGPGRGKKRVTFTNPDGSTYTTVVPNATKIVPQPGQTVKHVAKGEEAAADVSASQAVPVPKDSTAEGAPSAEGEDQGDGDGEGEGDGDGHGDEDGDDDDEGDEDGDENDDREEGEIDDDTATPGTQKPEITPNREAKSEGAAPALEEAADADADTTMADVLPSEPPTDPAAEREASSSPELPLARTSSSHSRQNSDVAAVGGSGFKAPAADMEMQVGENTAAVGSDEHAPRADDGQDSIVEELRGEGGTAVNAEEADDMDNGDDDLLGSLERHLEG